MSTVGNTVRLDLTQSSHATLQMAKSYEQIVRSMNDLLTIFAPWLWLIAGTSLMLCVASVALRGTEQGLPLRRMASILAAAGIASASGLIAGAFLGEAVDGFDITHGIANEDG